GARFLFVKRDRMDTAMRILMKHYQTDTNPYAYDLETALGEIDWYHNMMDLWQERLPERSMTLRYEEVVADPAKCLAAAAGLCGISADLPESLAVGDDRGVAEAYRAFLTDSAP
ncbi:MAG TPA: sulfotransferase, partial [Afifellaceae bacterium]|nr:sulfotransferase [Afifellaceae bacterium]